MRIVHILLGKANPNTMNGVNKVVHSLATEMQRAGHEVEVWGLTETWQNPPEHEREYRLRLFPVTKSRLLLVKDLMSSLKTLSTNAWVQLHSVFVPEFHAIAKILDQQGIAFGITPHGGYSRHVFDKDRLKKTAYMALVESGVIRRATLFHAIGASEVEDIRRIVPAAPVTLVPNGQEPLELATVARGKPREQRPIFAFCGRLAMDHKGLDLLLEGFGEYRQAGGSGTLWLIGDGPDRDALEGIVTRLSLGPWVRVHGARFGAEKLRLLASADAFVHTSRWDGVPTAVLEAAAAGLPLLVSRETNMADAVAEFGAGAVVDQNTPREIAAVMGQMATWIATGDAERAGKCARAMVTERYAWPRLAKDLVAGYQAAMLERDGNR